MSHFIYSTHTNPIQYVEYDKSSGKNHNVIKRRFVIAGGHGLCNKNLITPQGVVTRVEKDADMEWLLALPAFNADVAKGYIKYSKKKEDPEKMAKNMTAKDGSSPKTPNDFKTNDAKNHSYSSNSVSMSL